MTEPSDPRPAQLAARWPEHAPFVAERSGGRASRRDQLYAGVGALARVSSPGRLRAERRGAARVPGHPALPEVLDADLEAGFELLEPCGPPSERAADAVIAWPWSGIAEGVASRREWLERRSDPELRLDRAASRLELPRRHLDRWLDAEVALRTRVGPGFGGAPPEAYRDAARGVLVLSRARARADAWLSEELAALGESSAAHRRALGEGHGSAADAALELARFALRLREATLARDEVELTALAEELRPGPVPEHVRVWITGPPCVPEDAWEAPGATVSAARARWLLGELHGLAVAGGALEVRTDPAIRAGRRRPRREPRRVRERRLFSRYAEGVELDEEGRYSVTPEALAMRLAAGARGVVLDATCGLGGLTIAYARQPGVRRVIAVDRDAGRLAMARRNAALYGVAERVEWIAAEALDVVRERSADLLVVDPPWGGPGYDRASVRLSDLPMDLAALLAAHAGDALLKLPRSFEPASLPGEGWRLEPMLDERGVLKFLAARRLAAPSHRR